MNKEQIALKSGYYFNTYNKDDIPFFNELEKTNKQILKDNITYDVYQAPTWEVAQKVDAFMDKDGLGYDLDEYQVNNNLNI